MWRRWRNVGVGLLIFGIALIPIGLFGLMTPAATGNPDAESQAAVVAFADKNVGQDEFAIAEMFDIQGNDGTVLLTPSNNAAEMTSPPDTAGNFSGFNGSTDRATKAHLTIDSSLMSATYAVAG